MKDLSFAAVMVKPVAQNQAVEEPGREQSSTAAMPVAVSKVYARCAFRGAP